MDMMELSEPVTRDQMEDGEKVKSYLKTLIVVLYEFRSYHWGSLLTVSPGIGPIHSSPHRP